MKNNQKIFMNIFAYILMSFFSYIVLYYISLTDNLREIIRFLGKFSFIVMKIPRFDRAFNYINSIGDFDRVGLIIMSLIWMIILLFIWSIIFNKENIIITKTKYYNNPSLKGFLVRFLFVAMHIIILFIYFIYMFFISFLPFSEEKFYLNLGSSSFNLAFEMIIHQLFLFVMFMKPTRFQGLAAQNTSFQEKL